MNAATNSGICFSLRNGILSSYKTTQILTAVFSRVRVVKENMIMTVRKSLEYEKTSSVVNTETALF